MDLLLCSCQKLYQGDVMLNPKSRVSEQLFYLQVEGLPMLQGQSDLALCEVELVAFESKDLFGLQL